MTQEGAPLPVRIAISHPETDEPPWIRHWDGSILTTARRTDAAPDAGDIDDRGGYAFNQEWEVVFAKWDPEEVAAGIVDLHSGAGFSAPLLPNADNR